VLILKRTIPQSRSAAPSLAGSVQAVIFGIFTQKNGTLTID